MLQNIGLIPDVSSDEKNMSFLEKIKCSQQMQPMSKHVYKARPIKSYFSNSSTAYNASGGQHVKQQIVNHHLQQNMPLEQMLLKEHNSASKAEYHPDMNFSLKQKTFNLSTRKQSHQKLDTLNDLSVDLKLPHIFLQDNKRKKHHGPVLQKVKVISQERASLKNARHLRVASEPEPNVAAADKFMQKIDGLDREMTFGSGEQNEEIDFNIPKHLCQSRQFNSPCTQNQTVKR